MNGLTISGVTIDTAEKSIKILSVRGPIISGPNKTESYAWVDQVESLWFLSDQERSRSFSQERSWSLSQERSKSFWHWKVSEK